MPDRPPRMIAVWCPDWPVTTARLDAGLGPDVPAAVFVGNIVLACSQTARQAGVRRGLRRREAQARCPELAVLARNEAAEARTFEPVVAALESIAPGVEITRPGLAAINVKGPTRYFGGETAVLHALSRAVLGLPQLGGADVVVGIADGAFAAE
jgi:protein ImuB